MLEEVVRCYRSGMVWGRAYFTVQAIAGGLWWLGVFTIPWVRTATLGGLDTALVAAADIPLFVVASAIAAFGVKPAAWVATGWTVLVTVALGLYASVTTEAGWGVLLMIAASGASLLALSLVVLGRIPTEWLIAGPFAFRTAKPRAAHAQLAVTIAQLLVFWGLFLGVGPTIIALVEQRWRLSIAFPDGVRVAGAVVFLLASALGVWSACAMSLRGDGTPLPAASANRLVLAGPYRWVRNPMAVAGIVQGAAIGLMVSSWLVVIYALVGSVLWNYAVRPLEERDLDARFGADYRAYRDSVRCWIPTIKPRTAPPAGAPVL